MPTIVERISTLHRELSKDPEYRKYTLAKNDSEAVEGGLTFDTCHAACMLRQAAAEAGDAGLAGLPLPYIWDAINELIGRWIDPAKVEAEEREWRESVGMFLGLDDDDVARNQELLNQRNKPQ
jgi:hypothetical protein